MTGALTARETAVYLVSIPGGIGIGDLVNDFKREGLTRACSPAQAVSQYVFGQVSDKQVGRLVMHRLGETTSDREKYARPFEVPVVEPLDGEEFTLAESQKMSEYVLAQELAGGRTPNGHHVSRARKLLNYSF